MIILMKGLNEEKSVKRCIGDFHDEPFVKRIIVIDGRSQDHTVPELRRFSKVEVYIHPWFDWYHDMEVCQSNIALSYVPNGEIVFIMDFDEKMSPELKKFLSELNERDFPLGLALHFSRKTVDVIRYEDSPHAVLGEDGWPIISHQIGQYPDYQCRLFIKTPKLRWVNSPHHVLIGHEHSRNVNSDIIHYEKDDYRDRIAVEKKWLRQLRRRKQLGLPVDIFDCKVKTELAEFNNGEYWDDSCFWG